MGQDRKRLKVLLCAFLCVLGAAGPASASKIIAGNASRIQLAVDSRGQALVTYRDNGRVRRLLAWGAIGYGIDWLAGTSRVFTAIGFMLGGAGGIYLVYLRYGREGGGGDGA